MKTENNNRATPSQVAFRVLFYLAGLLVLAFGVSLARRAELGISPVSSTPLALFEALSMHGASTLSFGSFTYSLTFGNCVTAIYILYILLQLLILRKDFKPINLLQILVSFVFGWFVDFAGLVLGGLSFSSYPLRLLALAVSIVLIATGISLYLSAKLLPMSSEGLGMVIAEKLRKPYHKIKVVIDCAMVAAAILIMLAAGGNPFSVVREGTVVTAIMVGIVMGFLKRFIDPLAARLGFSADPKAAAVDKG